MVIYNKYRGTRMRGNNSIRRMVNKRNTSSMKTLHSEALIITINTKFYISLITIQVKLLYMLRS